MAGTDARGRRFHACAPCLGSEARVLHRDSGTAEPAAPKSARHCGVLGYLQRYIVGQPRPERSRSRSRPGPTQPASGFRTAPHSGAPAAARSSDRPSSCCRCRARRQNKGGIRILTVWCSQQSCNRCKVACFNIAGSQVVGIDIEVTASVAKLQEAIFAEITHEGHWRLITPNGKLLDNPTMLIADMLGDCTP